MIVLLAVPAFPQDDFGGFGGDTVLSASDIDALFGGGGGNRNQNNNQNNIPNPENLFLTLRDLLKTKKAPLSKDQEKTLRPFIEMEVADMRTYLESQFGNRGNNNNQNRNQANMITELFNAIGKSNTELLTSIKESLTPDQAALITKAEKDKKTCTVVLDLLNPQQQNRGNDQGFRGNRGGGPGGFNPPAGFEDLIVLDGGGGGNNNRGGGNRGNNNFNNNFLREAPDRAYCTSMSSTTAERVAPISQILTKGKKPLTPDQEKKVGESIETKLAKMEEDLKGVNPEMQRLLQQINESNRNNRNNNNNNQNQTVNPQTLRNNIVNTIMSNLGIQTNNNNNNNNRGRGDFNFNPNFNNNNQNNQTANAQNPNNQNPNNQNPNNQNQNNQNQNFQNQNRGNRGGNNNFNLQQEIQKKNEELLDHIAAKLNPDQGTIVKKYKYDQIKAKGGADRYRAILEQENTPLTPEQFTQIRNLFNAQNQAVRVFADQKVQEEMAKQTSLDPPPAPPNPNGSRPNPNNVNSNPVAQRIVSTVMPLVSRQHAILEKATGDTIMKLLTPPQVASYKINSL
jgi:hypothetical protein